MTRKSASQGNAAVQLAASDSHLVHSFADLWSVKQSGPTVISKASGAMVYDAEGNRFLDGIGGLWCVNVGHGRDEIIEAIAAQMRELDYYSTFYNLSHPLAARLSTKLAELAPGQLNHVYFANSGSVANDTAVRILHARRPDVQGDRRQERDRSGRRHLGCRLRHR